MKIKGRIFNPVLARGSQWQAIELEIPATELLEKLRELLLGVAWTIKDEKTTNNH